MSKDIKPLVFRTLEGKPVVPSWLRHASQQVMPASGPLARAQQSDLEPEPYQSSAPEAAAALSPAHGAVPAPVAPASRPPMRDSVPPQVLRRSSLPPRLSAPPPPVVITRPPTAPPVPAITPAEQLAYVHAALELASLRARTLAQTEAQLLELAVAIAETILERQIERDPTLYAPLARAAVAALGDTRSAKLRVARAGFRAITEMHGEEPVEVDGVRVELVLDNSLEGLGVIAESGASKVDGRVRERLAAVLRALEADHRRQGAPEEA